MNKGTMKVKITKEILEERYEDLNDIFLGAYSKKNMEVYMNIEDISDFYKQLKEIKVNVRKELLLINTQLRNKNIKSILEDYDILMEILSSEDISIDLIVESEYSNHVKLILKQVLDYHNSEENKFNSDDDVNVFVSNISEDLSLTSYFNAFYEYHQALKDDLFDQTKLSVLKMYIKSLITSLEVTGYKKVNKTNELEVKSYISEIKKKEKVIHKKKEEIQKLRLEHEKTKKRNSKEESSFLLEVKEELLEVKKENEKLVENNKELITTMVTLKKYKEKESEAIEWSNKYREINKKYISLEKLKKLEESESKLDDVEKYLKKNGLTKELYQIIYMYTGNALSDVDLELLYGDSNNFFIGYCKVEDNNHYIYNFEGSKYKLLDIPEDVYLQDNQFVRASKKMSYIKSYNSYYEKNTKVVQVGEVSSLDPLSIYTFEDGIKVIENNNYDALNRDDIIGLDNCGRIHFKYKTTTNDLSDIKDSILAKGHSLLYINRQVSNGYIGINLDTEIDEIVLSDEKNLLNKIVIMNSNDLIKVYKDHDFIINALPEGCIEFGTYEIDEHNSFISFENGSRVMFKEFNVINHLTNETFSDGDVLEVDSFKNIIGILECVSDTSKTIEDKIKNFKSSTVSNKEHLDIQMHDLSVLIIGNESLSNSYKCNFLKHGYKVEVISGHESYFKIKKQALKSDLVVFATTAASHQNYYKIKTDFTSKIIYSNGDGVNKMLELVAESA